MIKNIVLALSLLINGLVFRAIYYPPTNSGERMTCDEARSSGANATATAAFAERNSRSLIKTHQFLKNSDYDLRNIGEVDGQLTFVYTANFYPSTCGVHLPGIDGSIVRVRTDGTSAPLVKAVN